MAQGGSIENVKLDTGSGKFFIADNDDIPSGSIVQGTGTGGIAKIWTGTQAQYDAIATKATDTLYIIVAG